MQDAHDFHRIRRNAIEHDMWVREHGTQPRRQLVTRSAHQRMLSGSRRCTIDLAKYIVGHFDRADAGKILPDIAKVLSSQWGL